VNGVLSPGYVPGSELYGPPEIVLHSTPTESIGSLPIEVTVPPKTAELLVKVPIEGAVTVGGVVFAAKMDGLSNKASIEISTN
jgi:hypothetical protein